MDKVLNFYTGLAKMPHTQKSSKIFYPISLHCPLPEIEHPSFIIIDTEADQYCFDHYIDILRPILPRIKGKIIRTAQKIRKKLMNEENQF
jgi:hypothetical protein